MLHLTITCKFYPIISRRTISSAILVLSVVRPVYRIEYTVHARAVASHLCSTIHLLIRVLVIAFTKGNQREIPEACLDNMSCACHVIKGTFQPSRSFDAIRQLYKLQHVRRQARVPDCSHESNAEWGPGPSFARN